MKISIRGKMKNRRPMNEGKDKSDGLQVGVTFIFHSKSLKFVKRGYQKIGRVWYKEVILMLIMP
jgi:hypothetical protein